MEEVIYRRRDGIAWREEPDAEREVLEDLAAGRDASAEGTMLLVERGRVHELNFLGAEIWKLCDGSRGVEGIVEDLFSRFNVERGELERDVRDFIAELESRGWVVRA